VNLCELVLNLVRRDMPNNADRHEPKGDVGGSGFTLYPDGNKCLPGKSQYLTFCFVTQVEHGKPVSLPARAS